MNPLNIYFSLGFVKNHPVQKSHRNPLIQKNYKHKPTGMLRYGLSFDEKLAGSISHCVWSQQALTPIKFAMWQSNLHATNHCTVRNFSKLASTPAPAHLRKLHFRKPCWLRPPRLALTTNKATYKYLQTLSCLIQGPVIEWERCVDHSEVKMRLQCLFVVVLVGVAQAKLPRAFDPAYQPEYQKYYNVSEVTVFST